METCWSGACKRMLGDPIERRNTEDRQEYVKFPRNPLAKPFSFVLCLLFAQYGSLMLFQLSLFYD